MEIIAKLRTESGLSFSLIGLRLYSLALLLSLVACGSSTSVNVLDSEDNQSSNNSSTNNGSDTTNSASSDPIVSDAIVMDQQNTSTAAVGNFDESGIALSINDLSNLLYSDYRFDDLALQPKSSWVCAQNSLVIGLYFLPVRTLDVARQVMVERRLSEADSEDKLFFWQASDSDALALISTTATADNTLLSTGSQFEFSTIRFEIIEGEQFFKANTNLYGELLCVFRESER